MDMIWKAQALAACIRALNLYGEFYWAGLLDGGFWHFSDRYHFVVRSFALVAL